MAQPTKQQKIRNLQTGIMKLHSGKLTNIGMGNPPFEDVFPIKNGILHYYVSLPCKWMVIFQGFPLCNALFGLVNGVFGILIFDIRYPISLSLYMDKTYILPFRG